MGAWTEPGERKEKNSYQETHREESHKEKKDTEKLREGERKSRAVVDRINFV